jgi:hypothetical protein
MGMTFSTERSGVDERKSLRAYHLATAVKNVV